MQMLVCAAYAVSIALLTAWLSLQLLAQRRNDAPVAGTVRRHWLLRGPVGCCARQLAPLIPAGARATVLRALERAGLDGSLEADEWIAIQTISAALAAAVSLAWAGTPALDLVMRALLAALAGGAVPWLWLRERIAAQQSAVLRELPGYLDLLTLGLEAGCAFGAALQIAVKRSMPGPLRAGLEQALQEMRAGRVRADALQRLERRIGVAALTATVAVIAQAEATGVSLAPVIRAQSMRGTQERFARAEKLAMEAPVKMLAPLVLCIFPCTFIVVGFPIAVRLFWGS